MKTTVLFVGAVLMLFLILPRQVYAYRIGDVDVNFNTSVREVYDDNITYTDDNKKEDYRNDISLGVSADYEGKTRRFRFRGDVTRQTFNSNSDFNNTSAGFTTSFTEEFSKFNRVTLSNRFVRAEEPRSFDDEFGRTSGRYSYTRNNFDINYSHDVAKNLTLIGTYGNEVYSPSRTDLNDSYLNRLGFEADYYFSSQTMVLGFYQFLYRSYKNANRILTNRIGTGVRHYLNSQLYIDGRVGGDFSDNSDGDNTNSTYISTSLTSDVDENTKFILSYFKDASALAYSQDVFDSQRFTVTFIRQLLKRLGLAVSTFIGTGEYSASGIEDDLRGANINLLYDISEKIKLNLSYNYSETDSNSSSRDYSKNTFLVGLSFDF